MKRNLSVELSLWHQAIMVSIFHVLNRRVFETLFITML